MHLVYRAMEKEPVPSVLPSSLIPPSKRKKSAGALPGAVSVLPPLSALAGLSGLSRTASSPPLPGAVAALPGLSGLSRTANSPPLNDTLHSTPPHRSITSINSSGSLSPKPSFKAPSQVQYRVQYRVQYQSTPCLVTGSECCYTVPSVSQMTH
jgi:epidermal growth factor receptor substrate 15